MYVVKHRAGIEPAPSLPYPGFGAALYQLRYRRPTDYITRKRRESNPYALSGRLLSKQLPPPIGWLFHTFPVEFSRSRPSSGLNNKAPVSRPGLSCGGVVAYSSSDSPNERIPEVPFCFARFDVMVAMVQTVCTDVKRFLKLAQRHIIRRPGETRTLTKCALNALPLPLGYRPVRKVGFEPTRGLLPSRPSTDCVYHFATCA